MAPFQLLHQLPEELLQDIIDRLDKRALDNLNLVSKRGYEVATPQLWREVNLVDCRTQRDEGWDEHDDGPLIKKLVLLAT